MVKHDGFAHLKVLPVWGKYELPKKDMLHTTDEILGDFSRHISIL